MLEKGIYLKRSIGLGDAIQFTSLPENYYRTHGVKLIDVSHHPVFDFNPYLERTPSHIPGTTIRLWEDFIARKFFPPPNDRCQTNAQFHAFNLACIDRLKHPKLYIDPKHPERFEVIIHPKGISHSVMPEHIQRHVIEKYGERVIQVGLPEDPKLENIPWIPTPTLQDLAELISRCKLFIGMHSGPAWVAACYPYIQKKVIWNPFYTRSKIEGRIPLRPGDLDSMFDDLTLFEIYNQTDQDINYTKSWRAI